MHYLILAICSSSLIALMMRISEKRVRNNISELAVNYAVCLILSVFYVISQGGYQYSTLKDAVLE